MQSAARTVAARPRRLRFSSMRRQRAGFKSRASRSRSPARADGPSCPRCRTGIEDTGCPAGIEADGGRWAPGSWTDTSPRQNRADGPPAAAGPAPDHRRPPARRRCRRRQMAGVVVTRSTRRQLTRKRHGRRPIARRHNIPRCHRGRYLAQAKQPPLRVAMGDRDGVAIGGSQSGLLPQKIAQDGIDQRRPPPAKCAAAKPPGPPRYGIFRAVSRRCRATSSKARISVAVSGRCSRRARNEIAAAVLAERGPDPGRPAGRRSPPGRAGLGQALPARTATMTRGSGGQGVGQGIRRKGRFDDHGPRLSHGGIIPHATPFPRPRPGLRLPPARLERRRPPHRRRRRLAATVPGGPQRRGCTAGRPSRLPALDRRRSRRQRLRGFSRGLDLARRHPPRPRFHDDDEPPPPPLPGFSRPLPTQALAFRR